MNLDLVEAFLAGSYRVKTAQTGDQGLRIARDEKPDLILLDIMMPEMDGYEVCQMLQEDKRTACIPVIFVTAKDEERDKARAFAVGAADYLVKPIGKERLKETIEANLKTTAQWGKFGDNGRSWYDKVQSSDFIRFKEFLAEKLNLDAESRFGFSKIPPPDIYRKVKEMGIDEKTLAQDMAQFLKLKYAARIDPESIRLGVVPSAFARANHVVAIRDGGGRNGFVLSNPFDWKIGRAHV